MKPLSTLIVLISILFVVSLISAEDHFTADCQEKIDNAVSECEIKKDRASLWCEEHVEDIANCEQKTNDAISECELKKDKAILWCEDHDVDMSLITIPWELSECPECPEIPECPECPVCEECPEVVFTAEIVERALVDLTGAALTNYDVYALPGGKLYLIPTWDIDTEPPEEPDPICGDGNLDLDEECDDGNLINGDGCSSECIIEADPDEWATKENAFDSCRTCHAKKIDEGKTMFERYRWTPDNSVKLHVKGKHTLPEATCTDCHIKE